MTFVQGYLDSLCGLYSIVNAYKIINDATDKESASLFNEIIEYLNEKGTLKDIIIEGTDDRVITRIMADVVGYRIPWKMRLAKKEFKSLAHWWKFSRNFMEQKPNRAIILSLDGKTEHLTVINRITDRTLFLTDSSGISTIRRSMCKMKGYSEKDKYIIFPNECWYLGKD